ncbi:hypothetical protein, variant 1 [Aphanomyces astaci]|uniref:Polycystin domain-containing protein n=1 Tax=Aphanomyces astaci TaxID=112090 RepID=W4G3D6_APHAT|nr:hypothetical protein, variant 1 [Aphanomyces astaci]ETV74217.1 hypothetical protein, variant 1 [Aphanomyces astaci]|eukprot:XP_009836322.1 hypothetical protein, variant 1 [Aphanomyces astaci]
MRGDGDGDALLEPLVDPSPSTGQARKEDIMGSLLHEVKMSPWEKYWYHGRVPWKVVLHVLLMLCGTLQIMLYDNQNSAYVRASYRNWAYFFLPNGASTSSFSMDTTPLEESIFTVNDTLLAVAHVRDAYFSIKDLSVATYDYHYASPSVVQPMLMSVIQYQNKTILPRREFNITPTSLGPFDDLHTSAAALAFLHSIVSIDFAFPLRDIDYGPFYFDCFDWTVRLTLAMHENSHLRMRVDECSLDVCSVNDVWATLRGRFLWLNLVVAGLTVIYIVLLGRSLLRAVASFSNPTTSRRVPWTQLPLLLLRRVLTLHHGLVMATLVLVLFNALWNISSVVVHVPLSFGHRFVQALGPLLLWTTFVGYLEPNRRFYSIVLTLGRSLPKVLGFLVGVSPVFFGYALFGSIVFGYRVQGFGGIQVGWLYPFLSWKSIATVLWTRRKRV